jgi:hypothetical protein
MAVKSLPFRIALLVLGVGAAALPQDSIFSGALRNGKWTAAGPPERYEKEGLYGYIDGGAELFLQYGFLSLDIGRFKLNSSGSQKEVTLEVYRMDSSLDAFGIFSIRRDGGEKVSKAVGTPNWYSKTQAGLVKDDFFINIVGLGTTEEDLEQWAAWIERRIEGPTADSKFVPLGWLPAESLISGTERYIKGELAAREETDFFGRDFWGFAGKTEAASAKYDAPGIKLIVLDFKFDPKGLAGQVKPLFEEYLKDVSLEDEILIGKNSAGYYFLFRLEGRKGFLVQGRTGLREAADILRRALKTNSKGG